MVREEEEEEDEMLVPRQTCARHDVYFHENELWKMDTGEREESFSSTHHLIRYYNIYLSIYMLIKYTT